MWTSLYNFICNKLFHKPEISCQRRNGSCDGIYGKRSKLIDRIWDSNDLVNQKISCSMQKENVAVSNDEEDCCIIAEIPRRKKPGNSITVQNTSNNAISPVENLEKSKPWSSFTFHREPKDDDKDIEEVKCSSKALAKDFNSQAQTRKFFSTHRSSLSQGKTAKFRSSFKNQLKKKVNFLQESYRLTEKFQYMQLLQSHTSINLFITIKKSPPKGFKNTNKQIEVIDITDDKSSGSENETKKSQPEDQEIQIVKEVPGIRSFQDILKIKPMNAEIAITGMPSNNYNISSEILKLPENADNLIDDKIVKFCPKTESLEEKLRNFMQITGPEILEVENRELYHLPELTLEQERRIENAFILEPRNEVLSHGFGLQIKRLDIQTLFGLNWLNDEIINFYMNLIMERSKFNSLLPKVYSFSTFFYPKLVSSDYASLRRWTKQVDIFSFDIILLPIHLGMHWCLSVIDFRNKSVRYYDSVGSPNDSCLEKLIFYLKAESLDKKKKIFPAHLWRKKNVEDIPQQMNGSDCGVFSCMFAEHLARDCSFFFTQDDMPYFRKKMVIEILEKKLLT